MLSLVRPALQSGTRVIGLLLDGICAAHRGDIGQLAAIASAIPARSITA